MGALPQVLASSVIRGSRLGESHGGLYLLDLERGRAALKLDWNAAGIDFSGRGGDRGLRGIAFHGEDILVAANAELLCLDRDFRVRASYANPYLQHCHEIAVSGPRLFLAATGFDAVLAFDLERRQFTDGWHLDLADGALVLRHFDPGTGAGPAPNHRFHINSVSADRDGLWFSGLRTPGLLRLDRQGLQVVAALPEGTHNAQLQGDALVYNDTAAMRVVCRRSTHTQQMPVPEFDPGAILNAERFGSEVARPRFARGLCALGGDLIAAGCSPSTVAVYDLRAGKRIQEHTLSMDIRNAIHGLALWPYA